MRVLLVVYDNDSYIHCFPIGIAYIAAALRKQGIDVEVYSQDVNHYPDKHLTEYLNKNRFDVIGVGVIGGYYQYRKLLNLSEAINQSRQRPFYIIGGHGPSPEAQFFMNKTKADVVVIGEGEVTIVDLLSALSNHQPIDGIKGIAYRNGEDICINERQPLIVDIDTIPWPAYDLFPIEYYRLYRMPRSSNSTFSMRLLSGRGCPHKCNFCYRMDEGFRPRSNQSIIEEIVYLKREYRISYISFEDDLLMSSVERTESLCRDFIKASIGINWACNGRLNYARKDLLKLMKEAGCLFINYGIEALDDQVLRNMKKGLTTRQIYSGVEATLETGISPGLNVLFGNIGDTLKSLEKGVKFLLKYDDGSQLRNIRPVTPYPGSDLYYDAIEKGLLKDCEEFYESRHMNSDLLAVNFTDLSENEFHQNLLDANTKLVKNHFNQKTSSILHQATSLYIEKDTSFRGFRHS
jgi:radical SAM superfamily enzyme YgiQ (UPF0313 family)